MCSVQVNASTAALQNVDTERFIVRCVLCSRPAMALLRRAAISFMRAKLQFLAKCCILNYHLMVMAIPEKEHWVSAGSFCEASHPRTAYRRLTHPIPLAWGLPLTLGFCAHCCLASSHCVKLSACPCSILGILMFKRVDHGCMHSRPYQVYLYLHQFLLPRLTSRAESGHVASSTL